jgi:hypothetical protein
VAKKRTQTRSKRVTAKTAVPTKAEIMRALDKAQTQTVSVEDMDVKIAQTDVLDTTINFVNAWIAHPRDQTYIGKLHEVLVRNTLVLKYKMQIAAARSWPEPVAKVFEEGARIGPGGESDATYAKRRGFVQRDVPRASRGLLRTRGISDVVAEREGVR